MAGVVSKHPGKCSPETGVRMFVERETIRAYHRIRMLQYSLDVVLTVGEVDGACWLESFAGLNN